MNSNQSQGHIKSLSSQQDTRNPTTNKKVIYYTPVQKHSHPRYYTPNNKNKSNVQFHNQKLKNKCKQLNKSMYQLKSKKQQCLRSSRYNQAKYINEQIHSVQRKRAKTQAKRLLSQHKSEKKMIKKAHKKQMSKFQQVWQDYFIGLRAKQQITLINFKKSQQNDIRFVQQQLVQKCKSLKISTGQLKSLQKKQNQLRKQQRYQQLQIIKKQKKHLKQKLLRQQQQKIYNWAKKQQQFLKTYHTKKYNALINRIQEMHNDKYRQYQRQGHRLRLKYHNVMKKLQHQQKLQVNQLFQKFPFLKQQSKGRSFTVNI